MLDTIRQCQSHSSSSNPSDIALTATLTTWNQRLAHINVKWIKSMVQLGVVKGIILCGNNISETCTGCVLGKSHRAPFPKTGKTRSTKPLQLIHSDVLGPIEVKSLGDTYYFVSFIDNFSKRTTVYIISHKSKVLDWFKHFKSFAEKHTRKKLKQLHVHEFHGMESVNVDDHPLLKYLRSDNGGEYLCNNFKQLLFQHGMSHQLTVAYTAQHNGVAERMNRRLLNMVRSMLHHR